MLSNFEEEGEEAVEEEAVLGERDATRFFNTQQ